VHESSPYTYLSTRGKPIAMSLLVGGALLAAWKIRGGSVRKLGGGA